MQDLCGCQKVFVSTQCQVRNRRSVPQEKPGMAHTINGRAQVRNMAPLLLSLDAHDNHRRCCSEHDAAGVGRPQHAVADVPRHPNHVTQLGDWIRLHRCCHYGILSHIQLVSSSRIACHATVHTQESFCCYTISVRFIMHLFACFCRLGRNLFGPSWAAGAPLSSSAQGP